MSGGSQDQVIRLRGVRQNNLKNLDLDLPLNRLIVVSGLSGSGKSSLAYDTLFAEGQRRYIETFSPYARQFFDRMDKPRVDRIEGIPPAIAIEQKNTVRTTRSTVGTMTEICDFMRLLWPHLARLYCRQCGAPVQPDTPASIWESALSHSEAMVTFELPLSNKLSLRESLELVARQGYQRLLLPSGPARIEECLQPLEELRPDRITVIQDRVRLEPSNRARFAEACEQAYHFGKGGLALYPCGAERAEPIRFSNRLHCARCDIDYREPSPALFSFNHPLGACPTCRGFGRIITIDYDRALPDRSKTLARGVVRPWQTGQGRECQDDLLRFCRLRKVPVDVPFESLPPEHQAWVIEGDPDYGRDAAHEWPRAWYGVKGYFRWLESKAYKMHVRVLLSRYRAYLPCADCHGARFQPEALRFKAPGLEEPSNRESNGDRAGLVASSDGLTLADVYRLPIEMAHRWIVQITASHRGRAVDAVGLLLREVESRLRYLVEVGLGYLTLDRPSRTLSGGETERVNLTTCLGTRLVNTLYVLDEPSVGLHARDTGRLIEILKRLRDGGNTVIVVEHEPAVIRAADQIVDLGPKGGEDGGQLVFQGDYSALLRSAASLTGAYLSGRVRIPRCRRRSVDLREPHRLTLRRARLHNLKDLTVQIPLRRFVGVTGVSGSGKTTLVREVLFPLLTRRLSSEDTLTPQADVAEETAEPEAQDSLPGGTTLTLGDRLDQAILVDQSPIGKTPRSTPAVFIGAFEEIRTLFAQTDAARQRGLNASAFSFNSARGQCERCRGAGFEKIEMQFLSDVFVRCPDCDGRRYRGHVLEVALESPGTGPTHQRKRSSPALREAPRRWNIADFLEATVDGAVSFLVGLADLAAAQRALASLRLLQEVGLGYLKLGQPINTLSGGESQRLKLVGHLAAFDRSATHRGGPTLFAFDEPTTGLHFDDVRVLLGVFQRLVDAGHSLLVVEHNLEVIQAADWLIDLGPEAGDAGGRIVAQGTPEEIANCAESHTGRALREAGIQLSTGNHGR